MKVYRLERVTRRQPSADHTGAAVDTVSPEAVFGENGENASAPSPVSGPAKAVRPTLASSEDDYVSSGGDSGSGSSDNGDYASPPLAKRVRSISGRFQNRPQNRPAPARIRGPRGGHMPVYCHAPSCRRSFRTNAGRRCHYRAHPDHRLFDTGMTHVCPVDGCDIVGDSFTAIVRHAKEVHRLVVGREQGYRCYAPGCGAYYKSEEARSAHYTHVPDHSGADPDRPHGCDLCPYHGRTITGIKVHRKSHRDRGPPPFVCPAPGCGCGFFSNAQLTAHYRGAPEHTCHDPERKIRCGIDGCLFRTHTTNGMSSHCKAAHDMSYFDRPMTQPARRVAGRRAAQSVPAIASRAVSPLRPGTPLPPVVPLPSAARSSGAPVLPQIVVTAAAAAAAVAPVPSPASPTVSDPSSAPVSLDAPLSVAAHNSAATPEVPSAPCPVPSLSVPRRAQRAPLTARVLFGAHAWCAPDEPSAWRCDKNDPRFKLFMDEFGSPPWPPFFGEPWRPVCNIDGCGFVANGDDCLGRHCISEHTLPSLGC